MQRKRLNLAMGVLVLLLANRSNAQLFKRLKDKVSSKLEEKANSAIDSGFKDKTSTNANSDVKNTSFFSEATKTYDFVPGNQVVFQDDFMKKDSLGTMPHLWKTSGSGEITTFPNRNGRWLSMNEFTSYKLTNNQPLPANFTIEFDIATQSNTRARDLESLTFGFAHDNNISSYISDAYNENAITTTQIHYWNKEIINSSSDTKINNSTKFPLAAYAIGKMHVAIVVKAENMKVYLDKVKVLDTRMFLGSSSSKYFYLSPSTRLDNEAKIGISNFVVASI